MAIAPGVRLVTATSWRVWYAARSASTCFELRRGGSMLGENSNGVAGCCGVLQAIGSEG